MKTKKRLAGISLLAALLVIVGIIVCAAAVGKKSGEEAAQSENVSLAEQDTGFAADAGNNPESISAPETESEEGSAQESETDVVENEYTLVFQIEGMTEEVPAEQVAGNGYSILIPQEGWHGNAPDSWQFDGNDMVQIWVTEYPGKSTEQVTEEITADGFTKEDELLYLKKADNRLLFQKLVQDGTDVWGIFYTYPDEPEMAEGFGSRLPVIAASFRMQEDTAASETGIQDIATSETGIQDTTLSEDAQKVQEIVTAFSAAFFNGNRQEVQTYLADSFAGNIDVRESTEEVSAVTIKGLEQIQDAKVGDTCVVSVEYLDSPENDSFWYLEVELIKQTDDWKVSFYGIGG